jgi:serine/threonine protein kinase
MTSRDIKWIQSPKLSDNGYSFVKYISKAMMGDVIYCSKNNRDYAIKIIKKSLIKKEECVLGVNTCENPRKEIEFLKKIHSSGHIGSKYVIELIETFEDDNNLYIVMEYLDKDICYWILKNGRLKGNDLKYVFKSMVLGLQSIHNSNIAHLDISLENMMMFGESECKIIDLGLALDTDDKRVGCLGKIKYIAPELYSYSKYNLKLADVFSLGVCLFVIAIGIPPWRRPHCTDNLFRKIVIQGDMREQLKKWRVDYLSENLIDLLEKILCCEDERITLDQILSHPFCK